jgi:hypothetical protein
MAAQSATEARERLGDNYVSPKRTATIEPPLQDEDPGQEVDLVAEAERIFNEGDDQIAELIEVQHLIDEIQKPLGLHGKLAWLRSNFGFVAKTGRNTGVGGGYSFVEATSIGKRFVEMCGEIGLTMLPVSMAVQDPIPTASGKQLVWTVSSVWRITDVESGDYIEIPSFGQGADNADKALPKAQTNCMKYAILLVLQAAGDDPENDPRTDNIENGAAVSIGPSNVPGVIQGGRQAKVTEAQMNIILTAMREADLGPEAAAVLIASALGGKAPVLDDEENTDGQKQRVVAFLRELDHEEAGAIVRALDGIEPNPSPV